MGRQQEAIRRPLAEILQPSVGIPTCGIRPTNENPHEGVAFWQASRYKSWLRGRSTDVPAK